MDSIKNAVSLLMNERTTLNNRVRCIDAAISALRIGGVAEPLPAAKVQPKSPKIKTAGLADFLRETVEAMPEGTEFTSKQLAERLPPHLAQAGGFIAGVIRTLQLPVEKTSRVTGPGGYTSFRKRVTTGNLTPAPQFAVA